MPASGISVTFDDLRLRDVVQRDVQPGRDRRDLNDGRRADAARTPDS